MLTFSNDGLVLDVTAFIVRTPRADDPHDHSRPADQPLHERVGRMYARFGLPERLDG